jgi:hypothetical protein
MKPGLRQALDVSSNLEPMRLIWLLIFGFMLSCTGSKVSHSGGFRDYVFKKYREGFVLSLPSDWTYVEMVGVDSYIGQINTHSSDTLYFSFGIYSLSDRPIVHGQVDEGDYKKRVRYQNLSGYVARIVTHSKGRFSDFAIHFDSLWVVEKHEPFSDIQKLTIYGTNLSRVTKNTILDAVDKVKFIRDSTAANTGLMQTGSKME